MSYIQQQQRSLPQNFRSLLESGLDADISVVAADGQLTAHSSVLMARSPVFAAILRREQRVITIPDMPEEVVRQLLSFLYTDEAPQLQSMAPELLALADRYELLMLKEMCEQHLIQDLRVDNTVLYCVLALRHSCPHLKNAAIDYFTTHALSVLGSQGWAQELRRDPRPLVEISRMVAMRAASEASMEELRQLFAKGAQMDEDKMST